MTDDQKALADELDRLSADAARLADCVRRLGRAGDGIDDLREGFFLTVAQAATVCGVTDQAVYNWIGDAERMGRPIAEKRANVWIIDTARLFAYVEKHRGGLPARVEVENRLREFWPKWSEPKEWRPDEMERVSE
ncbi:hypothetical protein AS156_30270 [Bradyrhizobium macuxiense]|uniref:Helix-turn-helix domain-containing protein n=1 Tax=Bradyrhizobium macuxiense TaxID=1755647 RepID=A0A125QA94_9BRAD|nr:helix-turn-helix domain-containing protein [Bradyrhizobium macuxiense]KWV59812.1 hypothetical protein AS156_30270 [Bradyrhizobium macuxiense]